MSLISKLRSGGRRLLQSHATAPIKKMLWNKEFASGRWDHLQDTAGDCVYSYVERWADGGDILDLGCGSGNTGNELDYSAYRSYLGVDISDVAIEMAIARSAANRRDGKNRYVQSDITTFAPDRAYSVILFRESINYLPVAHIEPLLRRYRPHLGDRGVFIVRLYDRRKYEKILQVIREELSVIEECAPLTEDVSVVVFR
ncbi:class I SAM-dependent methyltransferase [Defluviicoccus vanus]|uniref:Class I SAM-dependent methyltransferase n=1 Tax=Defluviicoccus vanus TaxID=111831 RepID=A0A7H1N348_9PROT|nr:class I SAM-dependent methyltransferase [Defluviicoccus vanus]QNT70134.1 class I SAM-dependent methyltransferase [Defluviicoccus vanus]